VADFCNPLQRRLTDTKDDDMFPDFEKHPVNSVRWLPVDQLEANDYNPNHVLAQEFRLLKTSILKQGWLQPILVAKTEDETLFTIIDGFHRATLAKTDKQVREMTSGMVPCAVLELNKAERQMLTVRINRAKGSHSALRMHELVKDLIVVHQMTVEQVCEGIGATKHEVEVLMQENLFKKFDVENTPYSKAWMPR
jgi:ParB-like chromosome segregation protein Spo0J